MDLGISFRIARIRGIDIRIHWSWFIVFWLVAVLTSSGYEDEIEEWTRTEAWIAGVVTSVLFFFSVVIHELSHSFVAQHYKMPVNSITLFVLGGVSSMGGEMRSAREELRIALAGPISSWLLAALFALVAVLLRDSDIAAVPALLAFVNALLGTFNMLPGFPMDGGRVLRAIVWARSGDFVRATRVAATSGSIVAYGMIAVGVLIIVFGNIWGLWWVLIGWFLRGAAQASYQAVLVQHVLAPVTVQEAMQPPPELLPREMTVQELVDDRVLTTGDRCFLVGGDGAVIGLVSQTDVTRLARDKWAETTLEQAMVLAEDVHTTEPDASLADAAQLMQQHDVHQLPVVQDGQLRGMLTRADVMQQLELRQRFGPLQP